MSKALRQVLRNASSKVLRKALHERTYLLWSAILLPGLAQDVYNYIGVSMDKYINELYIRIHICMYIYIYIYSYLYLYIRIHTFIYS